MPAYPARPLQLILTLNSLTTTLDRARIKGQWLAGMRVDASAVYHFKHPQKDTHIALSTTRRHCFLDLQRLCHCMASGACATSPHEWLRKNRNSTRLRLTIGCYRDETKYRWGKVHVFLSINYTSWLNTLQLKAFRCRVTSYGR